MSASPDDNTLSDLREAERQRLFNLPDFPRERPDDEKGVLLSDRIRHYCSDQYKLIEPFTENLLRPAGYVLTVGRNYSTLGERKALSDGMSLEIGPYQVAIIETYETLNMPRYLVGRWNVRVTRAYEGLLWVGGAQVDPGFRGHLCCPIYNLSTKAVTLTFRDKLAMIDFVTTTPYEEGKCKKFPWRDRNMLVFSDYPVLSSGIEAEVKAFNQTIEKNKAEMRNELTKAAKGTEERFRAIDSRIDTFLTLIFAVVAVLFTGLGILATTRPDERYFMTPLVAGVALYFALRAHHSSGHDAGAEKWYAGRGFALAMTAVIVLVSLAYHFWDAQVSTKVTRHAEEQASKAVSALEKERQDRETAVRELRQQFDARLGTLEQEINLLRQNQGRTK